MFNFCPISATTSSHAVQISPQEPRHSHITVTFLHNLYERLWSYTVGVTY
jgi:hypothetical protein